MYIFSVFVLVRIIFWPFLLPTHFLDTIACPGDAFIILITNNTLAANRFGTGGIGSDGWKRGGKKDLVKVTRIRVALTLVCTPQNRKYVGYANVSRHWLREDRLILSFLIINQSWLLDCKEPIVSS